MKITTCPHCRSTKHEMAEEQSRVAAPCDRCGPIFEAGCADERARIRGWLGQQSGQADRESRGAGIGDRSAIFIGKHKAFKEAADHLKPTHVKAGLAAKRAARKAVVK